MEKQTFIILLVVALALIGFVSVFIISEVEKSVKAAYVKGLNERQPCNCSETTILGFNQGYSKAITDTQNATLLLGYCAAQQEAVKNGFILANNTTLVTPTSILKSICFR